MTLSLSIDATGGGGGPGNTGNTATNNPTNNNTKRPPSKNQQQQRLLPLHIGGSSSSSDALLGGGGGHAPGPMASTTADYGKLSILDIARLRTGWLVVFCAGLLVAALVVEQFEDVLERHVELSFFVPLIMGHGGNSGSQSASSVIRALALRQVHAQRDATRVVLKEAGAGALMGALLGLAILAFSFAWPGISPSVGAVVAVALPVVSVLANSAGALLTIASDRLRFDPAVTAVPFMTTLVDSLGLVIYFYLAKFILGIGEEAAGGGGGGKGGGKGAAAAAAAASPAGRRLLVLASSAVAAVARGRGLR